MIVILSWQVGFLLSEHGFLRGEIKTAVRTDRFKVQTTPPSLTQSQTVGASST